MLAMGVVVTTKYIFFCDAKDMYYYVMVKSSITNPHYDVIMILLLLSEDSILLWWPIFYSQEICNTKAY